MLFRFRRKDSNAVQFYMIFKTKPGSLFSQWFIYRVIHKQEKINNKYRKCDHGLRLDCSLMCKQTQPKITFSREFFHLNLGFQLYNGQQAKRQ